MLSNESGPSFEGEYVSLPSLERLGHSKPSITLDVYGHIIKDRDERAAAVIAEALK